MTLGVLSILAYATGQSRTYCGTLGIFLLLAGFLGFVPGVTARGMLLGFVDVNRSIIVLHLIRGVAAIVFPFSLGHDRRISPTH